MLFFTLFPIKSIEKVGLKGEQMKWLIVSIIVFLTVLPLIADTDLRPRFEISSVINDGVMFKTKAEMRYSSEKAHYYTAFDFGSEWNTAKWLTICAYYRHINQYRDSIWTVEYRPIISGIFKMKLNSISFSNENKMEFRFRNNVSYRYINKTQIKSPPLTASKITLYGGDEFAVSVMPSEISRNRVFCGFDLNIINGLKGGLCYIWEHNKSGGNWNPLHVIQSNIKYSF